MKSQTWVALMLLTPFGAALQAAEPAGASAPAPTLEYAFSVRAELAPPLEQGEVNGARQRFIGVTGGKVYGPKLKGTVLGGGGDWQGIRPGGLTQVLARYFIKADDGTVIGVTNEGVRVASPEVTEKLAKGIEVDPSEYYFRGTPRLEVADGPHEWLKRHVFVARGIRKPDHVVIDFYLVR
jgi:hypothetical protein